MRKCDKKLICINLSSSVIPNILNKFLGAPDRGFIKSAIDFWICTQHLSAERCYVCVMEQSWVISYSTLAVIPKHIFFKNWTSLWSISSKTNNRHAVLSLWVYSFSDSKRVMLWISSLQFCFVLFCFWLAKACVVYCVVQKKKRNF